MLECDLCRRQETSHQHTSTHRSADGLDRAVVAGEPIGPYLPAGPGNIGDDHHPPEHRRQIPTGCSDHKQDEEEGADEQRQRVVDRVLVDRVYLKIMSTWGFLPAVFRPLRTVLPGPGTSFLDLAGKTEETAKKRGKTGKNGREMA